MITRKVSGPHICLRCRLNLANRSLPQFRSQSGSASLPKATEARSEDPRDEPHGNVSDYNPQQIQTRTLHSSRGGDRRLGRLGRSNECSGRRAPVYRPSLLEKKLSKLSEYPLGKAHGHGAYIRRENVENLPSTSLGDPAKVIVLKDSIYKLYRHDQRGDMLDEQDAQHIDIQQALDEERGLAGEEEVNANIEALKPEPGEEPTHWGDINALVKEFQDGFKTYQLERYIKQYKWKEALEKPEPAWQTVEKGSSVLRITPWLPGISEIENEFDNDPLRGYYLDSHTPKQRVILRLLRQCWELELPELVHGIGQFEIQVTDGDLELLLAGTRSALDAIYNDDLNHDAEKLEVFRPRRVIRVTTTQDRKPWIFSRVQAALSDIRRETINVAHFLAAKRRGSPKFGGKYLQLINQNFDRPMLQQLGRLTQTVIVRTGYLIEVSCIESKVATSSSKLDSVKRLLLTCVNHSHRVEHQLAFPGPDTGASFVAYPPSFIKSLPWQDRSRDWTRLTAPITHSKVSNTPGKDAVSPERSEPEAIEVKLPLMLDAKSINKPKYQVTSDESRTAKPYWKPEFFTETAVLIGGVLHTHVDTDAKTPLNLKSEAINTFVTHVPNLSRFIINTPIKMPNGGETVNQIVLRFIPNPFFLPAVPKTTKMKEKPIVAGPDVYRAFPPIEMRLVFDRDSIDPKLKDIQAIVHESKTDVLLPQSLVDVRFQQRTTSCLQRRFLKQVVQYLKSSKLRLDGSSLEASPKITFPITKDLVQGKAFKLVDGASKFPDESQPEEVRDVEYLFAGLEIRSSIAMEWRGWRLIYTSIEAGKAGGRRSELKLRPMRYGKPVSEKQFIKQAYELVHEINGGKSDDNDVDYVSIGARVRKVKSDFELVRRVETLQGTIRPAFQYFYKRIDLDNAVKTDRLNDDGSRDDLLEDVEAEEEALEYDGWTGWEEDEEEAPEATKESS